MNSKLIEDLKRVKRHIDPSEKDMFVCSTVESMKIIDTAIDTIEALSAKLAAANMERSERYYNGGWKPISEYSREKYDWVLIKYFDGEEECIPQVAELREDGKWHVSTDFDGDFTIPSYFDVRYFFDMQQLDKE